MCTCQHIEKKDYQTEKQYRLADFFNMWWDEYCKSPKEFIEPEQYKAVNAIRTCRTAVLGIDYYACPSCGELSEVRHSCKNRFCPTCSWKDTVKWSEKIKSEMLDIAHRHSVFTLPHSLNPLIKKNKKMMLNMLARISADVYKSWFKSKYNVKIGIISVIHTYGEKKNAHYHIHQIVSWGGIHNKTGELAEFIGAKNTYINYNHIKKEFRRKYVNELDRLYKSKDLNHNFKSDKEFSDFKKHLHKTHWQFHIEEPMETPTAVIRYIGRYSKRACLSEYKITNIEGEYISFKYKDYKDRLYHRNKKSPAKEKELRLHYRDFFPLLLQHVPPAYFRLVRYYGCYGRFKNIPAEYKVPASDLENLSEQLDIEYEISSDNPKYCKECNIEKVYVYTLFDRRLKGERREVFDIKKHIHKIYKKVVIKKEEFNLKMAV